MTKRGFLKSMLLAAVAPQVLVAAAEDRYRWRQMVLESTEMPFDAKTFAGTWRFVEFRRQANGLWVKSGTGIKGFVPCEEPEHAYNAPYLEIVAPISAGEMIFHCR